jgi:hypothetical protein
MTSGSIKREKARNRSRSNAGVLVAEGPTYVFDVLVIKKQLRMPSTPVSQALNGQCPQLYTRGIPVSVNEDAVERLVDEFDR